MSEPRILLAEPTREEWLAERMKGIGGSEVAAIVGLSPYAGPLDVYCSKLGLAAPIVENRAMKIGKFLEPLLLSEYTAETGRRARLNSTLYRHPEFPWAIGTPDAFADEPGVELKAHGIRQAARFGEPGTDQIPDEHLCQISWYMAITGRESWDVAVLLGGQEFRVYSVVRNRDLEETLLATVRTFWESNVLAQVPPDLDGSESARAIVSARYPRNLVPLRPATPDESLLVDELGAARAGLAAAEEKVNRLETCLKESIAEADGIEGDGFRVTWKATKGRTSTDWKSLVADAKVPSEIVLRHTTTTPGSRRFLLQLAGGSDVR